MKDLKSIVKYFHNLKLLYVEDNKEARISTMRIFTELFDDIVVGVDGEDGLEKFKQGGIDLIITDISMPKMDGLEMLRAIEKIDENNVPAIIFSAHNEQEYIQESENLDVVGYMHKPIDMQEFLDILSKVISKRP